MTSLIAHEREAAADIAVGRGERDTRHIRVVINQKAGEVLQRGQSAFRDLITREFDKRGITSEIVFVKPDGLADAFQAGVEARPDAILVAGGDGTISKLLPQMMKSEVPVGLLPLGTLNLLARDLGFEGSIAEATRLMTEARAAKADLGEVNGKLFHSNAGLGFFARMAREREDSRRAVPFSKSIGFVLAIARSLWFHRPIRVDITVNGQVETVVTDAVLVTNNHFEGSEWRRTRLDSGRIEIHMLRASSGWGRMKAALAVYRGNWRSLPELQSTSAEAITITRRGKSRSRIALDGEVYAVRNPIVFRTLPGAV